MTQPDDHADAAIAAADRLQQSMEGLREDVRGLATYGKRNRHYIWMLAISLVVDLALTAALVWVGVQSSKASSLASRNQQTQEATCRATNDARAANRVLWGYIIAASAEANPRPTPAEQKQVDAISDFIKQLFAPRDCAHLDRPAAVPSLPTLPPR